MKVESILRQKGAKVETTGPDASVRAAADRLRTGGIAALVVTSGDKVVGLISEREIATAFSQYGEKLTTMTVGEIMRRDVVTASPDDHLTRIMGLMTQHRARHVPVLEGGRLAGIVSIGDIVKHRLDELELETRVLRDVYIAAR